MRDGFQVKRYLRSLVDGKSKGRKVRVRKPLLPFAERLEERKLLTLSVYLDNSNRLSVASTNNLSQDIGIAYDSNLGTYTITSANTVENFDLVVNTPVGLTVTKTDYNPVTLEPATLTVVETTDTLDSIFISTGEASDEFDVFASGVPVRISSGGGSDFVTLHSPTDATDLSFDGGAGDDLLLTIIDTPGAIDVEQSAFGSFVDSRLLIETSIDDSVGVTGSSIEATNLEFWNTEIDVADADVALTLNGAAPALPFGNLATLPLRGVNVLVENAQSFATTVHGSDQDDTVSVSNAITNGSPSIGVEGSGLPTTTFFGLAPGTGLLRILGHGGNDSLKAAPGVEDLLQIAFDGGEGNDFLSAHATLIGGAGDDTLVGGLGSDSLDGGLGDDLFVVSPGTDTVLGGTGFDRLLVSGVTGQADTFAIVQDSALPAEITVNGTTSTATLTDIDEISVQGSTGDDALTVSGTLANPVTIVAFLGAGDDSVVAIAASSGQSVTAYGEAGQDRYDTGLGLDTFYGGDDADLLTYAADDTNADLYDGGTGENTVLVAGSNVGVVDLSGVLTFTNGSAGNLQGYSLSRITILATVVGSGTYNLQANAGDNSILITDSASNPALLADDLEVTGLSVPIYLSGLSAGDLLTIAGNAGHDSFTVNGSHGADVAFDGGEGMDTLNVLPSSTAARFNAAAEDLVNVVGTGGDDTVTITQFSPGVVTLALDNDVQTIDSAGRYVINTWAGNDAITLTTSDPLNITLDAGDDNDTISASGVTNGGSNLMLGGGAGNDSIIGSPTGGMYFGGLGNDMIQGGALGSLMYGDSGNDDIAGGFGNDTIYGGDGDDQLIANAGNDQLFGEGGRDTLEGNDGLDLLEGGDDSDTLDPGIATGVGPTITIDLPGDRVDGGSGQDYMILTGPTGNFTLLPSFNTIAYTQLAGDYLGAIDAVEGISVTFGGTDTTVEVGDLSATALDFLDLDFPAGFVSAVNASGTSANDNIGVQLIVEGGTAVPTANLPWGIMRLAGTQALEGDILTIFGLGGDDSMAFDPLISLQSAAPFAYAITVGEGGDGNDQITGAQQSLGGDGDDLLVGRDAVNITPVGGFIPFTAGTGDDFLDGGTGDDTILGLGGDDSLLGGDGDDLLDPGLGNDLADPGAGNNTFLLTGGTVTINAGVGLDSVIYRGTAAGDTLQLGLLAGGDLSLELNGVTSTVTGLATAGLDAILFDAGEGADVLVLDSSNGLLPVPVTFSGGMGSDSLVLSSTASGAGLSTTYTPGPVAGQGQHLIQGQGTDQLVIFDGLEPVIDSVPADSLTVFGTNASNAISYLPGSNGFARVAVDDHEVIDFASKGSLRIDGLAGADEFDIDQTWGTPDDLTDITLLGGAPTAGDTVFFRGSSAADSLIYSPTSTGSGSVSGIGVPTAFSSIGSAAFNGRGGGDTLTVTATALADRILLTPGANGDSGTVAVNSFAPLAFTGLGTGGSLAIDGAGAAADQLTILATDGSDTLLVDAAGTVQMNLAVQGEYLAVSNSGASIERLSLVGLNGNDTFLITGDHPYEILSLDGGDPSVFGDSLVVVGSGPVVTVNLGDGTVSEAGSGIIAHTGIEQIESSGSGETIVVATRGDDVIVVTVGTSAPPMIGSVGLIGGQVRVEVDGQPEVTSDSPLTIDGGTGNDVIQTSGSELDDSIVLDATTIEIDGTSFDYTQIEAVHLDALGGNDSVIASGQLVSVALWGGPGDDNIDAIAATTGILIYGGSGSDFLVGSQAADQIYGDEGNDLIAGEGGQDSLYGGADSDIFLWNVGDGSDLVEGGTGADTELFNGSGLDEVFTLFAIDQRTILQHSTDAISVNMADVEAIQIFSFGGGDEFEVHDLSTTSTRSINFELFSDMAGDTVTVHGRATSDHVRISSPEPTILPPQPTIASPPVASATIVGLAYDVAFINSSPADTLVIVGGDGDDILKAGPGVETNIAIVLDGGAGDDLLSADATLLGGAGNDTFVVPVGVNTIDGGDGFDTILVEGTNGLDTMSVDQTGDVVALSVNAITSTNTVSNVELILVNGLAGNDVIDLSGSDTISTTVYAGDGNDEVDADGYGASTSLYGGSGDDMLVGGLVADLIEGGDGLNMLRGAEGTDTIQGGTGTDLIVWSSGDGFDIVDGGGGENMLQFVGAENQINTFEISSQSVVPVGILAEVNSPGEGAVAFNIQSLVLEGQNLADTFTIGDMTGSTLRNVGVDLGGDTVFGDLVIFNGNTGDNTLGLGGNENGVQVTGLPYSATVEGISSNPTGNTLDTIRVNGNAGYDTLYANASVTQPVAMILDGGIGNDTLYSEAPLLSGQSPTLFRVTLIGGEGLDTFTPTATQVAINGSGADVLHVNGDDLANTMSVTQSGTVLNATIDSSPSRIDVSAYTGLLVINGGNGNDTVSVEGFTLGSAILGGNGNDTLTAHNLTVATTLHGESGNDSLRGGSGNDMIEGGDGADVITWAAGGGADVVDGGTGDDRLVFLGSATQDNAITLTPSSSNVPSAAPGIGRGNANTILAQRSGDGSVVGSSLESVQITGGRDCNQLGIGNLEATDVRVVDVDLLGGDAVVSTYATNLPDVITITADAPDQIGVNGLAVPVRIFGAVGGQTAVVVYAGFGGDQIEVDPQAQVQAIIVVDGGAGDDAITGGSVIIGGAGNNLLVGDDGPNSIVGGTGTDTILGLGGNDELFGDGEVSGLDDCGGGGGYLANLVIRESATGAADQIDGGEGNNCIFAGEGNDVVTVGQGQNRIVLGGGNDSATTGDGNNTVFGGAGDDTVTTGSGNDVVVLGSGNDTATLGPGNDLAWGEDGDDFLIGQFGNDNLYGGNGNDVLWGGLQPTQPLRNGKAVTRPDDGNDVLAGEGGKDQLDGGTGSNIMDAGADNIRETVIGSGGIDTAYIHKNERKNQDVLKNHSNRKRIIAFGSMPVTTAPATPTDCDSPVVVTVPNPLSGGAARHHATKSAKKDLPRGPRKFRRK